MEQNSKEQLEKKIKSQKKTIIMSSNLCDYVTHNPIV